MERAAQLSLYASDECPDGESGYRYISGADDGGQIVSYNVHSIAAMLTDFKNNLDSIHNVIEKYDPKQKANIENAKVETNGLYVSLVISPDAEAIKSIFSEVTG